MMQIPCPFCGLREENEFTYGGRLSQQSALTTLAEPLGEKDELWRHTYGCGQWFSLRRDPLRRTFSGQRAQTEEAIDG